MIEQGEVKFFDNRNGKRFGFLIVHEGGVPTEEEIWFHFNDGEFIVAGGKDPKFSGKATSEHEGKTARLRDPKRGEVLVFQRSLGRKGDKASPWGYLPNWQEAEEIIANRPMYRVFKHQGFRGEYKSDPEILWEGSDLEELLKKYPLPTGSRSPGADPLISFWSHDDGPESKHWFERQEKDEPWERCDDPRPLPGVLRVLEAINR